MKNKILVLLICGLMLFSFVACSVTPTDINTGNVEVLEEVEVAEDVVENMEESEVSEPTEDVVSVGNPWTDCGQDLDKAAEVAGFRFDLILSNYSVKAMDDMFEITYPLDETRNVVVRKSVLTTEEDISGVYGEYTLVEDTLDIGTPVLLKMDGENVFILTMSAESGIYSCYCEEGMSVEEAKGAAKIIAEYEIGVIDAMFEEMGLEDI